MNSYVVKSGDNLSKIAKAYGSYIAGSTLNAKIDTLVAVNGIKNRNLIYPGQIIYFSGTAGGKTTSSSSSAVKNNKVTIDTLNLKAESTTGREVFACWSWTSKNTNFDTSKTKNYKVRWEFDAYGQTRVDPVETENTWSTYSIPEEFHKKCNWVQVFITPIAEDEKIKDEEGNETTRPYWTALENRTKYNFSNNPPFAPDVPTCEITDTTLTMKIDAIKKESNASHIIFQVVKDNTTVVHTSGKIAVVAVTSDYGKVSHPCTVAYGSNYKVRAKAVASNNKESGWTEFSDEVGTKPSAPSGITAECSSIKRDDDSLAVHLEWTGVANATKYSIEYATVEADFETKEGTYKQKTTDDARTSTDILIESDGEGKTYFFRVRAINDKLSDTNNQTSEPSEVVSLPVGRPPAAPSIYTSSRSAFLGELMELNWIHNASDNSKQTYAQLSFSFTYTDDNPGEWITLDAVANTTDKNSTDTVSTPCSYGALGVLGTFISYKGDMFFRMNTANLVYKNAKVQWKARTAGVTKTFSDEGWSFEDTIYIYEKPTLNLTVTKDIAGIGELITTLDSFPFYIRGHVDLFSHDIQRPVGYHLRIVSNDYYSTVDAVGRNKNVNAGDEVYSKYFATSETLIVEMSANNVDLETLIDYTVYLSVDMSTGLSIEGSHDFTVNWVDVEYAINADISVDTEAYTALITPYCTEKIPVESSWNEEYEYYEQYEDGDLVENVTLSVYRREYDGTYKEIASGVPNDHTSVTDPHPALDYARYRLVAKDTRTGAISFYDMAGYPMNVPGVVLQWDEEWSTFDGGIETTVEAPAWSGSLLKLPYNIKVNDNRKRDVAFVEYAGREHPVSYYGTKIDESPTWNVEIPKEDKETIYALRRLSLWSGDVYVRESTGTGYWANVNVSFNQDYDSVIVPVTLNITRVEGGI